MWAIQILTSSSRPASTGPIWEGWVGLAEAEAEAALAGRQAEADLEAGLAVGVGEGSAGEEEVSAEEAGEACSCDATTRTCMRAGKESIQVVGSRRVEPPVASLLYTASRSVYQARKWTGACRTIGN